jgi:alpha-glucuronidase
MKPHNGMVVCRTCVCGQPVDRDDRQPQDVEHDPAKVAYELFQPLDGKLDDNVVLQIKHGPMDFQVREPVSPVLAAMPNTRLAVELQVTQEYTGQQRHV